MKLHLLTSLVALPLVLAQAPFPIAQTSWPAAQITSAEIQASVYLEQVATQLQYQTFLAECALAVETMAPELANVVYYDFGCDPDIMGDSFFTAAATPAWYTALPSDMQSYVSSIAHAEATILAHAVGVSLSEKAFGNVKVMGAVLTAVFVGMLAL